MIREYLLKKTEQSVPFKVETWVSFFNHLYLLTLITFWFLSLEALPI